MAIDILKLHESDCSNKKVVIQQSDNNSNINITTPALGDDNNLEPPQPVTDAANNNAGTNAPGVAEETSATVAAAENR